MERGRGFILSVCSPRFLCGAYFQVTLAEGHYLYLLWEGGRGEWNPSFTGILARNTKAVPPIDANHRTLPHGSSKGKRQ